MCMHAIDRIKLYHTPVNGQLEDNRMFMVHHFPNICLHEMMKIPDVLAHSIE